MLGKPHAIELLFVDQRRALRVAPAWRELVQLRELFLTERCVNEYISLVEGLLAQAKRSILLLEQVRRRRGALVARAPGETLVGGDPGWRGP